MPQIADETNLATLLAKNIEVMSALMALLSDRRFSQPNGEDPVHSFEQAAKICGFTSRTLYREFERGTGPAIIDLSERRRGIRHSDLMRWLEARRRPVLEQPTRARGRAAAVVAR